MYVLPVIFYPRSTIWSSRCTRFRDMYLKVCQWIPWISKLGLCDKHIFNNIIIHADDKQGPGEVPV